MAGRRRLTAPEMERLAAGIMRVSMAANLMQISGRILADSYSPSAVRLENHGSNRARRAGASEADIAAAVEHMSSQAK